MDLTESAINKILELAKPEEMEIDGIKYTNGHFYPVVNTNYPERINITTLTGIKSYLEENVDGLSMAETFIVVPNYDTVYLTTKLDGLMGRNFYIEAQINEMGFDFNQFYNLDAFIIGIQSQFKDGENTFPIKQLLEFVSTIKSSNVKKIIDDGISQTTHLESGITGSPLIEVPGPKEPILLKPFRTFREIEQPESLFQLRMSGSGSATTIALYEADGGAWKIDVVSKIKAWLDKEITDVRVIA